MRRSAAAVGSAVFFVVAPGSGGRTRALAHQRVAGTWADVAVRDHPDDNRCSLSVVAVVVLVRAFARFVVEGGGTPAPVAPTERLVVGGDYRFVRNPMYLAVVTAVLGQAMIFGSLALLLYALAVWAIMAAFVRWYEEPLLLERYGDEYQRYRQAVRGLGARGCIRWQADIDQAAPCASTAGR